MRAVIQRVKSSSVKVEEEVVGQIGQGFLVLLAVHKDDTEEKIAKIAEKIANLRVFEDSEGKFNLYLKDVQGSILAVSQFTLYGNCEKGNRPSFIEAARPEKAEDYYNKFVQTLKEKGINTETGRFQTFMEVSIINDGPTTIIIDI